jgi:hypothetical protein
MVAPAPSVLDRLLDSVAGCCDRDSAQRLVSFQLPVETRARIEELAHERGEYLEYIDAIDLIAILQTKCKRKLAT